MENTAKPIQSSKAPKPLAPYSQAIAIDKFLFCSGQIGLSPTTGKLVSDDVTEQCKQAFENLKAVLEEAGVSLKNLVKVTVFLKDMNDYGKVNEVYASYVQEPFPARSAFAVKELPMKAQVEIEAIAYLQA